MVRQIIQYPQSPSDRYGIDVRVMDDDIKALINDLKETIEANDLEGLAAFQIGAYYNIVVIKKSDGSYLTMINPRIFRQKDPEVKEETTAYFPGRSARVRRFNDITVLYLDEDMQERTLKAEGDFARLIQRKIDYTFGSSFINKLDPEEKKRFEKTLDQGSDIAISAYCPTVFVRDKFMKAANYAKIGMVLLLIASFFVDQNLWNIQLYLSFFVVAMDIVYFFYGQYEGKKYKQCTSCQIGNIIGTAAISLAKLTVIMVASFFLMR